MPLLRRSRKLGPSWPPDLSEAALADTPWLDLVPCLFIRRREAPSALHWRVRERLLDVQVAATGGRRPEKGPGQNYWICVTGRNFIQLFCFK